MQTRDTQMIILDGYDAKLLQRLLGAEYLRLEPLEVGADAGRVRQERDTCGNLFNALSTEEGAVPRFQLVRTA